MRFGSREDKIGKDLSTGDSLTESKESSCQQLAKRFQIPSAPRRSLVISDNGGPRDRGMFSEGCDLLGFETLMCSTCLSASQTRLLHMPCSTAALSSLPCGQASASREGCFQQPTWQSSGLTPVVVGGSLGPQTSSWCL